MTEGLVYGQCRRCRGLADAPTYKCNSCSSNYVELFASPVPLADAETRLTEGNGGSGPALPLVALPQRHDDQLSDAFVTPIALVLALSASVASLIAARRYGGASISDFLKLCGMTGVPFILFALGYIAMRTNDSEAASAATTVGSVAAFIIGVVLVVVAGFMGLDAQATTESTIVSVSAILFVLTALVGGIASISKR